MGIPQYCQSSLKPRVQRLGSEIKTVPYFMDQFELQFISPSCELHVFNLIINRFHLDTVSLMINICFFFYPCPFGFKYSKQEQVMTYNVTVQRKTYEEIYLSIE